MSDEPMFQYVLARSRARETSTLAVMAIAAGASLVLLGFYLECLVKTCIHEYSIPWIEIVGLSFALFGFIYRKTTASGIQKNDENYLTAYIEQWLADNECSVHSKLFDSKENRKEKIPRTIHGKEQKLHNPLCYHPYDPWRELSIWGLMLLPVVLWVAMIFFST
jgi:hypothetical protein